MSVFSVPRPRLPDQIDINFGPAEILGPEDDVACILRGKVVDAFPVVQIPQDGMVSPGILEARQPSAIGTDCRNDNWICLLGFSGSQVKDLH